MPPRALSAIGRPLVTLLVATAACILIWHGTATLGLNGQIVLIVMALAVIGWTMTQINDTVVALSAALALTIAGVLTTNQLFASLGHELIWLLVASFVMAAILRKSGLVERAMLGFAARVKTIPALFYALTLMITATAFVVPSTSGRAALLLPVFLALADRITDRATMRALALLFPTAILLSAGGSLTGAGAHVIAADFMARSTGTKVDFLGWIALALPFAATTTLAATWLILRLFLSPEARRSTVHIDRPVQEPLTARQWAIAAIVAVTIVLSMTVPFHGLNIAVVALLGVLVLLPRRISNVSTKDAFKTVEVELIVFLAITFVLADSLSVTGADKWIASRLLETIPPSIAGNTAFVIAVVALVSVLSHLVITSRTARASVLIPSFAMPLAGLGHDPKLLIMVTVMGTGFCQTLAASAKPVALFANLDRPTYSSGDLLRLSTALLPVMLGGLMIFGVAFWHNPATSPAVACIGVTCGPAEPAARPVSAEPHLRTRGAVPARCDEEDVVILARKIIHEQSLYASGWWKVWNALRSEGIDVAKDKLAALYKTHDLVLLRRRSGGQRDTDESEKTISAAFRRCHIIAR